MPSWTSWFGGETEKKRHERPPQETGRKTQQPPLLRPGEQSSSRKEPAQRPTEVDPKPAERTSAQRGHHQEPSREPSPQPKKQIPTQKEPPQGPSQPVLKSSEDGSTKKEPSQQSAQQNKNLSLIKYTPLVAPLKANEPVSSRTVPAKEPVQDLAKEAPSKPNVPISTSEVLPKDSSQCRPTAISTPAERVQSPSQPSWVIPDNKTVTPDQSLRSPSSHGSEQPPGPKQGLKEQSPKETPQPSKAFTTSAESTHERPKQALQKPGGDVSTQRSAKQPNDVPSEYMSAEEDLSEESSQELKLTTTNERSATPKQPPLEQSQIPPRQTQAKSNISTQRELPQGTSRQGSKETTEHVTERRELSHVTSQPDVPKPSEHLSTRRASLPETLQTSSQRKPAGFDQQTSWPREANQGITQKAPAEPRINTPSRGESSQASSLHAQPEPEMQIPSLRGTSRIIPEATPAELDRQLSPREDQYRGPPRRMASNSDDQSPVYDLCSEECCFRQKYPKGPQISLDDVAYPPNFSQQQDSASLYEPLKSWQIRVIEVKRGIFPEVLQCELLVANFVEGTGVAINKLDTREEYDALSYSWGQFTSTHTILCNGGRWPIGKNLAAALYHLRKPDSERYIWCDALCINQADRTEKSQQVQNMMLRIFEKARQVVAWIGPDRDFRSIFGVLNSFELSRKAGDHHVAHADHCLGGLLHTKQVLTKLLKQPWFSRTWVRQEVFAAREINVQCGVLQMAFDLFVNKSQALLSIQEKKLDRSRFQIQGGEGETLFRFDGRNVSKESLPMTLRILEKDSAHEGTSRHTWRPPSVQLRHSVRWLRVLQDGCRFDVTDPRDRLYGLLGMIRSRSSRRFVEDRPEIRESEFPIDYTKTVSEVYQDVVKHLINVDRNLDILQVIEDRSDRAGDLPTWVPDWRQKIERSFINLPPAGKDMKQKAGIAPVQDLDELGVLRLTGMRLGSLMAIQKLTYDEEDLAEHFQQTPIPDNYRGRLDNRYSPLPDANLLAWGDLQVPDEVYDWPYLIPRASMLEDVLVRLHGSASLFLLRPLASGKFKFVGPVIVNKRSHFVLQGQDETSRSFEII